MTDVFPNQNTWILRTQIDDCEILGPVPLFGEAPKWASIRRKPENSKLWGTSYRNNGTNTSKDLKNHMQSPPPSPFHQAHLVEVGCRNMPRCESPRLCCQWVYPSPSCALDGLHTSRFEPSKFWGFWGVKLWALGENTQQTQQSDSKPNKVSYVRTGASIPSTCRTCCDGWIDVHALQPQNASWQKRRSRARKPWFLTMLIWA